MTATQVPLSGAEAMLIGLGAAKMIETGHIVEVLWIALFLLALLALLLLTVTTKFGIFTVIVAGVWSS